MVDGSNTGVAQHQSLWRSYQLGRIRLDRGQS